MRRLSRRLRGEDRGGIAVLVVALLGGGVLLGMLALVVDVGRLLEERAELQNGADAAAVALARSCAKGLSDCNALTAPAVAQVVASSNAKDQLATVSSVCGTAVGLAVCLPGSGSAYDCGPLPVGGAPYVQVRARTRTAQGGAIRALFAEDDTTVSSCARAAWGAPGRSTGISFTMSLCEWKAATANGTLYATYPPNPPRSFERKITLHHGASDATTTCPAGPSGADLPGGFGWLENAAGTCESTVDVAGIYADRTGNSTVGACKEAIAAARHDRQPIFVPIYDAVSGTGSEGTYHLAGFGAFVVTGYSLSGLREKSWLTNAFPCSGSERCISGFFVEALIPAEGPLAPPSANYGALIVRPIR